MHSVSVHVSPLSPSTVHYYVVDEQITVLRLVSLHTCPHVAKTRKTAKKTTLTNSHVGGSSFTNDVKQLKSERERERETVLVW